MYEPALDEIWTLVHFNSDNKKQKSIPASSLLLESVSLPLGISISVFL